MSVTSAASRWARQPRNPSGVQRSSNARSSSKSPTARRTPTLPCSVSSRGSSGSSAKKTAFIAVSGVAATLFRRGEASRDRVGERHRLPHLERSTTAEHVAAEHSQQQRGPHRRLPRNHHRHLELHADAVGIDRLAEPVGEVQRSVLGRHRGHAPDRRPPTFERLQSTRVDEVVHAPHADTGQRRIERFDRAVMDLADLIGLEREAETVAHAFVVAGHASNATAVPRRGRRPHLRRRPRNGGAAPHRTKACSCAGTEIPFDAVTDEGFSAADLLADAAGLDAPFSGTRSRTIPRRSSRSRSPSSTDRSSTRSVAAAALFCATLAPPG